MKAICRVRINVAIGLYKLLQNQHRLLCPTDWRLECQQTTSERQGTLHDSQTIPSANSSIRTYLNTPRVYFSYASYAPDRNSPEQSGRLISDPLAQLLPRGKRNAPPRAHTMLAPARRSSNSTLDARH
ncbi:hypothetical protein CC77DRAFT_1017266, partial [Alternaria alternata]